MIIDSIAVRLNESGMKVQSKAIVMDARHGDKKLILANTQTFMNLSGQSVQGLAHFYRISNENLIILSDDLDLPFGTLRIRASGGPGGQRGLGNILEKLGSKEVPRLRIGIGRPPGRMDPAAYVLQNFSRDEQKSVSEILDRGADAVFAFVDHGLNKAMNEFNGSVVE
jgi:PTH1 family peptidyl-tRNA hydrolase